MAAVTWKNISAPTRDTSGTETALKALSGAGASFKSAAKVFEDREAKVRAEDRTIATESARAAYRDATTPEQIAELNLQYSPQNTAGQNIDTAAIGKMAEGATSALRQRITAGQQFEQQQALRPGADVLAQEAQAQQLALQPGARTIAEQTQEAALIKSESAPELATMETDQELNLAQQKKEELPKQREISALNQEIALVKAEQETVTTKQVFGKQQAIRNFPNLITAATYDTPDGPKVDDKVLLQQAVDAGIDYGTYNKLVAEYGITSGDTESKKAAKAEFDRLKGIQTFKEKARFKQDLTNEYTPQKLLELTKNFTEPDSWLNIFGQEEAAKAAGYLSNISALPVEVQARIMLAGVDGTDFDNGKANEAKLKELARMKRELK